jgi:hypothetical protein
LAFWLQLSYLYLYPTTPRTPKELGFRGFAPFRVRRCYRLGLKMPASSRNGISNYRKKWLKRSVNSHTGGAMTKPVAVFRLRVVGDPRYTIRPSGSMKISIWCCFSLSAGISPSARYISATWPVEASTSRCYRLNRVSICSRLWVGYHVCACW